MGGRVSQYRRLKARGRRVRRRAGAAIQLHVVSAVATAAVVGVVAGGGGGYYAYAAMTVHDPAAFGKQIEELNTAMDQLEKLEKQVDQLQALTSAQGAAGAMGYSQVNDVVKQGSRLACRVGSMDAWDLSDEFEIPDLTSICDAANFARRALAGEGEQDDATGLIPADVQRELQRRRETVAEEAALHGVAVGLSERETGQEGAASLQQLAGEAAFTSTVREDQVVGNQISIRIAEELVAMRSLMAAMLEVNAAQTLRSVSVNPVARGFSRKEPNLTNGAGGDAGGADPFSGISK